MSNKSMKQPQYWTTGICIMLLSWVVFSTQTFEPTGAASADPTVTNNEVIVQSPGNSHFRSGHINWRPTGNLNEVEFNVLNSLTRSDYPFCVNTATLTSIACTGPNTLPGVGDVIIESIALGNAITGVGVAGTELFFGDATPPLFFTVTDGSNIFTGLLYRVDAICTPTATCNNNLTRDSFLAHAIDPSVPGEKIIHTYGAPGPFTAEISDFSRNIVEENNLNRGYRVSTIVNLGISNRSPVSTLPPVAKCPAGLCTFVIPATDADGDTLSFRLSTSAEASDPAFGIFRQPGEATAQPLGVSPTGTVTWDTTGFTVGLYSASITIEERRAGFVGPIGKVMVDFLIDIALPSFVVPPTPANGFTFNIIVGVILPFQVQCSDPNVGDSVTIGNLGLPLDATFTPAVPTGNPATGVFTFAPIAVQTVSVTFTCTDTDGNSAPPHTININVTPAPPLVVKTVHAEKESFNVIEDGIPFIKDVTIIAEIHEDLNNQLVIRKQVLVVTCLKIPDTGTVVKCSVSVPSTFFFPVSNCSETTVGSQSMNTIVQKKSSVSESDALNTVAKGFLVKTVHVNKEAFICDFDNTDPADDVKVDLLTFTEIFENLNRLSLDPPQDPIIKTTFETFRCVMSLETHVVEACDFPFIF